MRLEPRPTLYETGLIRRLVELLTRSNEQVNGLTEGRIALNHAAVTAAPTTGTWTQGDRLKNSAPVEAGSPAYVIDGWVCVASGTPGTWLEQRTLTGN
jgi:hypothetical protein